MAYPSITITRVSASPAPDRAHRGVVKIDYGPEGADLPEEGDRWGWYAETPLPYNIDYQVIARTRLQQQQAELASLLGREDRLPALGGYLKLPVMRTIASMDVIGGPVFNDSYDGDRKRIFEIHYVVRVFSEMTPWEIERRDFPDHVIGRIYNHPRTHQTEQYDISYTP